MRISRNINIAIFTLAWFVLLPAATTFAQKLPKSKYIQAQAMGTSTQLGRNVSVTIIIQEISPESDRAILIEAFQQKGQEGLVNALSKMTSKGRISITGTLGADLAYVRRTSMPDGSTQLRIVTNRLLRFGEVWADTRSSDYDLSGAEIILSKQKGKSSGTLLPATKLKLNKKGQMELELYQNPWKLVNVQVRN